MGKQIPIINHHLSRVKQDGLWCHSTYLDSVLGQLMGVGGAHDLVALDARVGDLAGDVLVAQTHNQAVLGGVVLVLVLERQAPTGVVVGASLATPLELDLVPLEVLLVLHDLDEAHFDRCYSFPVHGQERTLRLVDD